MDIWDLPGPAEFVDSIEYAVRNGANVITRFPLGAPRGLSKNLRGRLDSIFEWTSLNTTDSSDDLVGFLCKEICPQIRPSMVRGIADLAIIPEFQGRLIWVDNLDSKRWHAWSELLLAYSDISRNSDLSTRSSFIVVLNRELVATPIMEEASLVRHDFRSTVDELDLFLFALHNIPRNQFPGHHRALLAHTIASISKWDLFLAERMIQSPSEELLNPDAMLKDYASEQDWSPATPKCWENGTLDGINGQYVHSALLQVCEECQAIKQRLWSAQAAVLLPIVEERRVRIIEEYKHQISLPIETEHGFVTDPMDLSIGQLAWQLDRQGVPNHLRKYIRRLKRLRNSLAHMEPVSTNEAMHKSLFGIP